MRVPARRQHGHGDGIRDRRCRACGACQQPAQTGLVSLGTGRRGAATGRYLEAGPAHEAAPQPHQSAAELVLDGGLAPVVVDGVTAAGGEHDGRLGRGRLRLLSRGARGGERVSGGAGGKQRSRPREEAEKADGWEERGDGGRKGGGPLGIIYAGTISCWRPGAGQVLSRHGVRTAWATGLAVHVAKNGFAGENRRRGTAQRGLLACVRGLGRRHGARVAVCGASSPAWRQVIVMPRRNSNVDGPASRG